jgi:hypothetical protein
MKRLPVLLFPGFLSSALEGSEEIIIRSICRDKSMVER